MFICGRLYCFEQIGSANVKVNPDESFNEIPAISIPMEKMKPNEYSGCVLTIRVTAKQNGLAKNNGEFCVH